MNDYTLRTFRAFATKKLQGVSATPDLDVQVLLQHAMHYDKTQLLLFADNHIPDEQLEWLYNAIEKRNKFKLNKIMTNKINISNYLVNLDYVYYDLIYPEECMTLTQIESLTTIKYIYIIPYSFSILDNQNVSDSENSMAFYSFIFILHN